MALNFFQMNEKKNLRTKLSFQAMKITHAFRDNRKKKVGARLTSQGHMIMYENATNQG